MIICGRFSQHTTHLFLQFVSQDNALFKLLPSRNQKLLSGILTRSLLKEVVPPCFFSPRKKTQEKKTKVSHFFGNESTGLNWSCPIRHKKTTVFLGQILHDSLVVSRIH
jgi:hypothetical protein